MMKKVKNPTGMKRNNEKNIAKKKAEKLFQSRAREEKQEEGNYFFSS